MHTNNQNKQTYRQETKQTNIQTNKMHKQTNRLNQVGLYTNKQPSIVYTKTYFMEMLIAGGRGSIKAVRIKATV